MKQLKLSQFNSKKQIARMQIKTELIKYLKQLKSNEDNNFRKTNNLLLVGMEWRLKMSLQIK